jgi:NADH-quinone oxidoreductase subunit A
LFTGDFSPQAQHRGRVRVLTDGEPLAENIPAGATRWRDNNGCAAFAKSGKEFGVETALAPSRILNSFSPQSPMNSHPYAFLALFLGVAVAFPLIMLGVARLWVVFFQAAKPGVLKNATYECGLASSGDSWIQFKAHYYLYAILFLIFDVELLFLLPFAVVFTGLPVGALVTMLVFILLLVEGLVWAWHRGHLEWK